MVVTFIAFPLTTFCAFFMQCCRVSVNTTSIGLVIVELFLCFSPILLNLWTIGG